MIIPRRVDFLTELGMEPIEIDSSLGLSTYRKNSSDGKIEMEVSFSAVMKSLQISLRLSEKEIIKFSSEKVASIEIVKNEMASGLCVKFDLSEVSSEAFIGLEPDISCDWWSIAR
ncbi:hypothetical protein [Xanthomonas melonis]|uniref:hypothetical protein n=1 Tax=Xanthomonas melonis TaxID=56456 RepID=UPI0011B0639C|nr:hypothetical protein [Xanthomonas melonis]MCC4599755.1 hypothetical protein [Xanthomonas melonis]